MTRSLKAKQRNRIFGDSWGYIDESMVEFHTTFYSSFKWKRKPVDQKKKALCAEKGRRWRDWYYKSPDELFARLMEEYVASFFGNQIISESEDGGTVVRKAVTSGVWPYLWLEGNQGYWGHRTFSGVKLRIASEIRRRIEILRGTG